MAPYDLLKEFITAFADWFHLNITVTVWRDPSGSDQRTFGVNRIKQ
jgi:leucyl aminopeptidase